MSAVLKGTINTINTAFRNLGIKREYSYTDTNNVSITVTSGGQQTIVGEGYGCLADAVADLNLDAFEAMRDYAVVFKNCAEHPLPSRRVYETVRDLVDAAVDAVEVRVRDADGLDDRLNAQEAQYAVERGKVIIDQFSDAYRGGDLK